MTFDELKVQARGQWQAIHADLGINLSTHSHLRHTPCPGCGGKDRFRVTARYHETGGWICSQGGDTTGGDGFALIEHALGYGAVDQLKAVADALGIQTDQPIDQAQAHARRQAMQRQQAQAARTVAQERAERAEGAIEKTRQYLASATRPKSHYYLTSKGLTHPYNLVLVGSRLMAVIRDSAGNITGAQMIFGEREVWTNREWQPGDKYIVSGSVKEHGFHWLQMPPDSQDSIAIVEGWATGASLWEPEINHQGAVAVALDAGNVHKVASILLSKYPDHKIVVYADDDKAGRTAASQAVMLNPSRVSAVYPDWSQVATKPEGATDFNDWLQARRRG